MRKMRSARRAIAIGLGLGLVALPAIALAASSPVNTAPPTISGTFQVDATLSASDGTWTADPAISNYDYQWQRCVTGSPSVSATGSMSTPRSKAMSQLLPDGQVLVAGGSKGFDVEDPILASAELYDPNSGTFSSTGSMTYKRTNSAVAELASGKVLFVGGGGSFGTALTAEVYDPTSGTFSLTTGNPVHSRDSGSTANRLANGKVLVTGGSAEAELYDPASGANGGFSATGSMAGARTDAVGVTLADGRVLIAGGQNYGALSSAEIYDPASGTFSSTGGLNVSRFDASAVLLPDGRVLVAGGTQGGDTQLASAEIYNPESGTFSLTGPMPVGSNANSISLLKDGRVLVAGGFSSSGPTASTSIFDPITKTFSAGPSLGTARGEAVSAVLEDGRVLIAGGWTPGDIYTATAERFVPGAVTCSDIANTDFWQYQPQPADYLQRLRVKVTASNGVDPPGEATSELTPYIGGSSATVSADPVISAEGGADAEVGRTLTVDPKTWTGTPTPTVTYQWFSCEQLDYGNCDPIDNATSQTYVPVVADAGRFLAARVIGTNIFGSNYATSNRLRIRRAVIGSASVTGPGKAKRGKAAAFKIVVSNTGDAPVTAVKLAVSGKGVSLRSTLGTISPEASRSVTVRPKFNKTGRVSVTFKITSANGGTKTVRRVVRVTG